MRVMTKASFVVFLLALVLPVGAFAQVQISEVMYNPSGSDTGREWVELYNPTAADIVLVGGSGKNSWRIADSSNHTITDPAGGTGRGSLTIPAGGYFIISSDPTTFLSGEYAGGSYSVAKSSISFSNTGATVSVIDGGGTTVDSVTYTKDQGGNDDGASLQRQAGGTWIAGLPTPGAANTSTVFVADTGGTSSATTTGDATTTSSTQATPQTVAPAVSSYVAPPLPTVFADAGDDRTVIAGADTTFRGRAYDRGGTVISHVRYLWNFGDGTTGEGASVEHHYSYPGKYAAVLMVADQTDAVSDHFVVTAVPAEIAFTVDADGSIEIKNDDMRDLDLSGWIVRSFARTFTLPPETIVLHGVSLRISHDALGFFADPNTELEYPNGTHALSANQSTSLAVSSVSAETSKTQATAPIQPKPLVKAAHLEASPEAPVSNAVDPSTPVQDTATSSQVASVASVGFFSPWFFAAIGIAFLAAGGAVVARRLKKSEWDIVEESE